MYVFVAMSPQSFCAEPVISGRFTKEIAQGAFSAEATTSGAHLKQEKN
jgi:hypothetical protein